MSAPQRRPSRTRRRPAVARSPRPVRTERPPPLGTTPPSHRPSADAPTDALTVAPAVRWDLTARSVVRPGDVVGLDDSTPVRGLVADVVGARPSLVGTSSLDTLLLLSATVSAQSDDVRVRLFGGDHHGDGAFGGSRVLHAVTHTGCDVALVSARIVGDEAWVPARARDGRLGLLLAADRAYLVPDETPPPADETASAWVRLAAVADFAGVVAPPEPVRAAHTRAA